MTASARSATWSALNRACRAIQAEIAMADDTFTAVKVRVTGKASCSGMSDKEMAALRDEMQRMKNDHLGKPQQAQRRREAAPAAGKVNLWRKIDAQLRSMNLERGYLDGEIKTRIAGGIASWAFADEEILKKVIAALAYQQKRKGAKTK